MFTIPILVLSLAVAASAFLTIRAKYRGEDGKTQEYIFKPLTTVLIIGVAVASPDPESALYQNLIVTGLVASLIGDVALMLPDERWFLYGLLSFLGAHLLYIAAFNLTRDSNAAWYYIVPFVVYALVFLVWLWPHLGPMRAPVILYMAVIMIMAWQAANRWLAYREADETLLALTGAYLFVASDSVLAVERFRGTWRSAPFWVLSTYYAAQWLIALSV